MPELYTVETLTPLRRIIASRMTEAARIPQFRLEADVTLDKLLVARERLNAGRPAIKVSVNDCIIKACASALMKHPLINAQFIEEEMHLYHQANISVVVAVHGGLASPVIQAANCKSLLGISAEMKDLAARAAAGQLRMSEVVDGSFSISNLGSRGVAQFDAVINAPQCGILAVGSAKRRPVVTDDGEIRPATVMRMTLSLDHRAVDGAVGAAFLATLAEMLAQPSEIF